MENLIEFTPAYTPWGQPQSTRQIVPGIVRFDTASHGGYWVDAGRWRDFCARFPAVKLYAGPQWFEEDEDWAWVVMAWPEVFKPSQVYFALHSLTHAETGGDLAAIPTAAQAIANAWYADHQNDWWAASGSTAGGGRGDSRPFHWRQAYLRIKDNARRCVAAHSSVSMPFIATDAELADIAAQYPNLN